MDARRIAVVTGASSGIGLAAVCKLEAAGFGVFGIGRHMSSGRAGSAMIGCDVTDDASVTAAVEAILDSCGRIDVLVNGAGAGLLGGAEESSIDQAKSLFDVNFFGAVRMTNAVLPTMRRLRSGRIVNVSSLLGLIPAPFSAIYAASKHALEGYSESLDHEVRSFGIRVSLVEPAYTRTAFEKNMGSPDRPLSDYDSARLASKSAMASSMSVADDPQVAAASIVEAATAHRPKLRYASGSMAKRVSLLRRLVPAAQFDKSLRRQMGLPA